MGTGGGDTVGSCGEEEEEDEKGGPSKGRSPVTCGARRVVHVFDLDRPEDDDHQCDRATGDGGRS